MAWHGARYLIGCSSFARQEAAADAAAYRQVCSTWRPPAWPTRLQPDLARPLEAVAAPALRIPRLLPAYLELGYAIFGLPSLDREFKTVDP